MRLRAESEAADASALKSELEGAQAERMSLQKRIGLLTRKNEDLAGENGMAMQARPSTKLFSADLDWSGGVLCGKFERVCLDA